jgi:hypothetical protein
MVAPPGPPLNAAGRSGGSTAPAAALPCPCPPLLPRPPPPLPQVPTKTSGKSYLISGTITQVDDTTLEITELPIRKWTQASQPI